MYNDINEYAKIYKDSFVNESLVDEAMVSVDDGYINTVQTLLKDLKDSNPAQYDKIIARVEAKFGQQLPDAETYVATWRKNLGLDKAPLPNRDDMMTLVGQNNTAAAAPKDNGDTKIVEVTITDAKQPDSQTVQVTYDIIWSDGSTNKGEVSTEDINEPEFIKTKRWMHIGSNVDAAIALVFRSFSLVSSYPIKFTLMNKTTHVKTDISKFTELKKASKRRSSAEPAVAKSIDPKVSFSLALADRMNKAYGGGNVKFSSIYDDDDEIANDEDVKESFNESASFLGHFSNIF